MKLAEALILRSDLQKRIEQLKVRLNNNAKVQENDTPAEEPQKLFLEFDECIKQLNTLIKQINNTNNRTVSNGKSLSDLIADRDTLTLKVNVIRKFVEYASQKVEMYSNKEIKILSTVNVSEYQKEVDKISKQIRETDTELQRLNWLTDLIE